MIHFCELLAVFSSACKERNSLLQLTQLFPLCGVIFYRLLMCSYIVLFFLLLFVRHRWLIGLRIDIASIRTQTYSQCVFIPFLIVSRCASCVDSFFHTLRSFHIPSSSQTLALISATLSAKSRSRFVHEGNMCFT